MNSSCVVSPLNLQNDIFVKQSPLPGNSRLGKNVQPCVIFAKMSFPWKWILTYLENLYKEDYFEPKFGVQFGHLPKRYFSLLDFFMKISMFSMESDLEIDFYLTRSYI